MQGQPADTEVDDCAQPGQKTGHAQTNTTYTIPPSTTYLLVDINRAHADYRGSAAQNMDAHVLCEYEIEIDGSKFILHGVVQHVNRNHYTFGRVTGATRGTLHVTVYDDGKVRQRSPDSDFTNKMLTQAVFVVYRRSAAAHAGARSAVKRSNAASQARAAHEEPNLGKYEDGSEVVDLTSPEADVR